MSFMNDVDKPSSRVLKPPGGGSSNIFGGPDEPVSVKKSPNAKPTYQSSIFSSDTGPANPTVTNRRGHMSSNIFGTDNEKTNVTSPTRVSKTHQSSIFQEPEPVTEDTRRATTPRQDPITGASIEGKSQAESKTTAENGDAENEKENGGANAAPKEEPVKDNSPHLGPVKNTSGVRCAQPPGGKSSISFS